MYSARPAAWGEKSPAAELRLRPSHAYYGPWRHIRLRSRTFSRQPGFPARSVPCLPLWMYRLPELRFSGTRRRYYPTLSDTRRLRRCSMRMHVPACFTAAFREQFLRSVRLTYRVSPRFPTPAAAQPAALRLPGPTGPAAGLDSVWVLPASPARRTPGAEPTAWDDGCFPAFRSRHGVFIKGRHPVSPAFYGPFRDTRRFRGGTRTSGRNPLRWVPSLFYDSEHQTAEIPGISTAYGEGGLL